MKTLITAIQQQDTEALKAALTPDKLEHPIDGQDRSPLGYAVEHQHPQSVALLLAEGADPMRPDGTGRTPLLRALQGGRQTAELLLDAVVERGLIDTNCRRVIMRNLMGRFVDDEEHGACLDCLGVEPKVQRQLFDQFAEFDAKQQTLALADQLRGFCEAYRAMAMGIADETEGAPETETLFGYLMHDRDADRVEPWLQALKARLGDGPRPDFPWQDHRPLLARVRELGEDQRSGDIYARWVMLEAPFFSMEAHIAECLAADVTIHLDAQAKAITRAARAALFDPKPWILAIVSGIDREDGVDAGNPLLALANEQTRAYMIEHPRRLRNDAFEYLSDAMDLLAPAFGDLSAFVASLTASQQRALAAHHLSAFNGQSGGWLAMARALSPQGLLPSRLPAREDTASWEGMADWLISGVDGDLQLEVLGRIGEDGARRRRWSDTPQKGQVQARVLEHWLDEHPDEVDRLRANHVSMVGDTALLRRLILDERSSSELRATAIGSLGEQLAGLAPDEELLARHRAACIRIWCEERSNLPGPWMDWLWTHRADGEVGPLLIRAFELAGWAADGEDVSGPELTRLHDWYLEDPKASDKALSGIEYADYRIAVAAWEWLGPTSRKAVLAALATEMDEYGSEHVDELITRPAVGSLLDLGMAYAPGVLLKRDGAAKPAVTHLCEEGFEASLPHLAKLATKKTLLVAAATGIARITAPRLQDSGLLSAKGKAERDLALRGLCSRDDPDAVPVLKACLAQRASHWSQVQRGHMLDRLEHFGHDVSDLDPLHGADVAAFEAQVTAGLKGKRTDVLERLWNPQIEELGLPFSRQALRWSCTLVREEEWGWLPRGARQLWGLLSQERRAELASRLIDAWAQEAADNKDRWVLRLATAFGDDRLVLQLKDLVTLWNKKHYQRAGFVAGALGGLDTTYALFTLDEIRKSSKYRDVVRGDAYLALKGAAERRGIPLQELYDELVPTLDMGPEGLVLDVGPYVYRVQLLPDLALRVTHGGTGKHSKSLPKAKKDEDPELRATAESRFALLKKNIKPIVKQLGPRFAEAFDCGKSWNAARWQRLFLEHPILQLVAKSLIWTFTSGDDTRSFRISEDGSLIDREDEPVTLTDGEIRLWHPLEAGDEEIAGWRSHFADYELKPLIDQIGAPVHGLDENELGQDALTRFAGKQAPWGNVKRLMAKWDYRVSDQDGTHIAGYAHSYPISRIRVEIDMQECQVSMTFDEACVLGAVEFWQIGNDRYSREKMTLRAVPPRLVATVIEKLGVLTKQ